MSTEQTKILYQPLSAHCLKTTSSAWKDDSRRLDRRYSASYLSKFFHLSLLSKALEHAYRRSDFNSSLVSVGVAERGLFPLIPNCAAVPSLIQFLFELKENTSPEQLNCLFCYNKLRFSLHRKQSWTLHGISNTLNIHCSVRLISFLCLCTQSPSKHTQAPCS